MDQLRLHAERKCRKIMTPEAPFSLEVQHWYDAIHALKQLRNMLIQPNRNYNSANNYCFARRFMNSPKLLTLDQIHSAIKYCRIKQKKARETAEPDQQEMLTNSLAKTDFKGYKKKVAGIRQILSTECNKKNWGIVNAFLDDPRSPPLTSII